MQRVCAAVIGGARSLFPRQTYRTYTMAKRDGEVHLWTYDDQSAWGEVPGWEVANTGKRQSPINIQTADVVPNSNLTSLKLEVMQRVCAAVIGGARSLFPRQTYRTYTMAKRDGEVHLWTYDDQSAWGEVPGWEVANTGKRQSPINIQTADVVPNSNLTSLKLEVSSSREIITSSTYPTTLCM
jgi:carbonic anhydrase